MHAPQNAVAKADINRRKNLFKTEMLIYFSYFSEQKGKETTEDFFAIYLRRSDGFWHLCKVSSALT
jgi:hypothetical protein